ncbi:protein translocase subunit SecD [Patescibacteria group bacterium]|nr:protein translocase subunit SecD [Patescibacteria group bacterium]
MLRTRLTALLIFIVGAALAYFVGASAINPDWFLAGVPFRLGLDLQGGTHLVYRADVSALPKNEVKESMEGLRDVIERRVNLFGVTEPLVQVERAGDDYRLIVELAGVFNISDAIGLIGQTPFLEFRTEGPVGEDPPFVPTPLTGRFLKRSILDFNSSTGEPIVLLEFDDEGTRIFAALTKEFIGKRIAIYLDGVPISIPVVQQEITGGSAQISGQFTLSEARALVRRLNSGALPVPIQLISQQSIGASLGEEAFGKGLVAGLYGILAVILFLVLRYRLPGLVAVLSLTFYAALVLTIFKLLPVTLSAAGIAGFLLSVGMAVDANILIFERMREETRWGKEANEALTEGFRRAWPSIRDSNISSFITAIILYWFGTSIIRGFALTLGIGIISSIFAALVVSRTFLVAAGLRQNRFTRFLYGTK